jgi:hypothetical protein
MMGELGGLLAVQFSSPRCKRLRLLQRQDSGLLLLSLLLGTWIAAGPADWLRVLVVVVGGERVPELICRMGWLFLLLRDDGLTCRWFMRLAGEYERNELQDQATICNL